MEKLLKKQRAKIEETIDKLFLGLLDPKNSRYIEDTKEYMYGYIRCAQELGILEECEVWALFEAIHVAGIIVRKEK